MNLFTLDHETYYDAEYSLSKMSTEDYVTDPRYGSMLVSIKKNDEPVIWTAGTTEHITNWLLDHGVHEGGVICHNHMFDGLVNVIRHGFIPKVLFCTRFMAKALIQPYVSNVRLATCLDFIGSPFQKGTYVENMKGRRLESLSRSEIRDYAAYCCRDTEGTKFLFDWCMSRLPREELNIIDMTLRMYLEPQFLADAQTFENVLTLERQRKAKLLAALPEDVVHADLMSNPRFAQVLQKFGVEPPVKISPTTGKQTWAFAKNDVAWKELEDEMSDDPIIAPILAARIGAKSTLAETRAERMAEIGRRHKWFRVPLVFYAAHTGRYGGTEKINAQNLTRVITDKKTKKPVHRNQLRFGLQAPKGYSVIAADESQVEARLNAWFSDCKKLVSLFAAGEDVYSSFASKAFRTKVTKETHPRERFIGKTCILGLGYGMGDKKLQATLRKDDLIISTEEAFNFVTVYRGEYYEIPQMWQHCGSAIDVLCNGGKMRLGPCIAMKGKIELPNGMALHYPGVKYVDGDKYKGWTALYAKQPRTLWGGKIVENIIQALARITVMDAMRAVRKELGLRPALQAHDELVYIAPTAEAPNVAKALVEILCRRPLWAPDLPLAAEVGYGPTYGDCK